MGVKQTKHRSGKKLEGVGDVVVGDTPKKRLRLSRKHTLTVVAALVVLLVAGTVGLLLSRPDPNNTEAHKSPEQKNKDVSAKLEKFGNENNGEKDELATLKEYVDSKPPEQYKYQALMRLASAYYNVEDYDSAIDTYKKVDTNDAHIKVAINEGLASAYLAKKDYAKAKEYISQAIQLQKSNDKHDAMRLSTDESMLQWLETQK